MMNFEKLLVWQKAIGFAEILVKVANDLPRTYQYSFTDQLRRSALSIPSNIAEGAGRSSQRDRNNFYSISKGSLYESVNILRLLEKLELIDEKKFDVTSIHCQAEEIAKMLFGLSK